EILAGRVAIKYIQEQEKLLKESSEILSIHPKILPKTIKRFFEEWKKQRKTIDTLNKKIAELRFSSPKIESKKIGDVEILIQKAEGNQKELILQASEAVKNYEKAICILVSEYKDKAAIVGIKTPNLEINISSIINKLSKLVGGSGGGKGDTAMGGGPKIEAIDEVLEKAIEIIKTELQISEKK
ncbi:MAG: DHHA1 domain-containing protein, partial [Candidatus Heimdallarchaeaceae archaeon]